MTSSILQTAVRLLMPLLLLFAVFLTLRGHHQPGGGFVGGLVVAASFVLYSIAFSVDAARRVSGAAARAVEVDDAFLTGQGVGQWMELPLWIDPSTEGWRHFMEVDASGAIAAGLTFRPLDDTVAATLADAELVDGVGLTPERERELLEAWWSRGATVDAAS